MGKLCECGCGKETNIIKNTNKIKGLIKGEYYKFIFGHHLKGKPKNIIQKEKMSKTRKKWYSNNPEKAKTKAEKMQITKILNGTHAGKNNSNYGSKTFKGVPFRGKVWNTGLTKETNSTLKIISDMNTNEKNPGWKGDVVGYGALHNWMKRHKTKPKLCEDCKKAEPYDLANISGEYKRDIEDFKWICRSCHMKEDGRMALSLVTLNKINKKEVNNNGDNNFKKCSCERTELPLLC